VTASKKTAAGEGLNRGRRDGPTLIQVVRKTPYVEVKTCAWKRSNLFKRGADKTNIREIGILSPELLLGKTEMPICADAARRDITEEGNLYPDL